MNFRIVPTSAAVFALAAGALAPAFAAQYFTAEPQRLGKLSRILPPEFPKPALERGQTGFVDVEGVVHGSGRLGAIDYKPSSQVSSVFVAPLEKVLPHWKFEPVLGEDCQPAPERVTTRVEFAIVGGEAKVYTVPAKDNLTVAARFDQLRPVSRVAPTYPEKFRQLRLESTVYSKLLIDPSGDVTQVKGKAYVEPTLPEQFDYREPGSSQPTRTQNVQLFAEAAERALYRWKFPPATGAAGEPRVYCAVSKFLVS